MLWVDGAPYALGPVRFEFDAKAPGSSRRTITGDGVDLRFDPAGARFGHEDMVLIKSRFAQPYGRFSGTVRVGDVTSRIEVWQASLKTTTPWPLLRWTLWSSKIVSPRTACSASPSR